MANDLQPADTDLLLITRSVEQTEMLGERLGALLQPGDVVLLQGELGAGKTAFARGVARGAGSSDLVHSPTFVLLNEYSGPLPLYHADLYRLEEPDEVLALELSEYTRAGALIVEWPERGDEALPVEHLLLQLEHLGGDARRVTGEAHGARARALLAALRATANARG